MCGCNKGKPKNPAPPPPSNGGTQSFALDRSNGATAVYGSKLEALADNMRAGGTGRIRAVR